MSIQRSRRLADLVQSDIRTMTRECERVGGINLGQGICDLPTPPLVRDAAIQAIEDRKSLYSYPEGIAELRTAIATKLERDNGIKADPKSEIVVTAGSSGSFTCALHALLDPGDGLLIMEPYYGYHLNTAIVAGLEPQSAARRARLSTGRRAPARRAAAQHARDRRLHALEPERPHVRARRTRSARPRRPRA